MGANIARVTVGTTPRDRLGVAVRLALGAALGPELAAFTSRQSPTFREPP